MPVAARLLDDAMPRWSVRERHSRDVAAPVDAVWSALLTTPVADLPLTRALMSVRSLGRYRWGGMRTPVVVALPPKEVARRAPNELLLSMSVPGRPLDIAMDFRLERHGPGTTLRTETRVHAGDQRTRWAFLAYWLAIRAGSGLIRRELLRAIARRAESAGA
ncbi:MAG: hypothetical protein ACRDV2_00355 [Actinomycetes bacterium]